MNIALRNLPISPITVDRDNWIFAGAKVDPFVTDSASEAQAHADFLNGESLEYAVVRFNAVEGRCRDETHEFVADVAEQPDEYPDASYADRRRALRYGRAL